MLLLLERAFNTPLLIEQNRLNFLTSEIFMKLLKNENIDRSQKTPENKPTIQGQTYIIPVHGTLVNKNGAGASGVTSYEGIKSEILNAIDSGYTNLGFDISSGGGEASGNFPLAEFIKSLPSTYGVTTFAYTDSMAASAAYAIAASTQKIYATDMAQLGSIGTIMTLVDVTKADQQDGYTYTILRSKDGKALYNPHEQVTQAVIDEANAILASWDSKFNSLMNSFRPQMSIDSIVKMGGKVFHGQEAINLGLADHIVTGIEDVFALMNSNPKNVVPTLTQTGNSMNLEQALAQVVTLQSKVAELEASQNLKTATATQEERNRVTKILEAQATFGVSATVATNAITKGFSLEMVTELFTELKANEDAGNVIKTATASQGSQTVETIAALAAAQAKTPVKNLAGGLFSLESMLTDAVGDK